MELICPLCGEALEKREKQLVCPRGHSFDIARQGYVNLLTVQQKHSLDPGDTREQVLSRRAFLDTGLYRPIAQALIDAAQGYKAQGELLDVGCGEGYYTSAVWSILANAGKEPCMAGIDISKDMARRAAKQVKQAEIAVASAYHLPLGDGTVDLLLDCFSPLAEEEFRRVMKPGGHFLYVVPAADHLWEMKQVLYDRPYRNETKETPYEGFQYVTIARVRDRITLPCQEDIQALFGMTPYCWKTPRAGKERLAALDSLTTTAAFDIHIFERI